MTRPIRILGIDPGLRRTGWGMVEVAGNRLGFLGCGSVTTRDEDALLLRSFVWADQRERLDLLDRAISAVRLAPPELVRGDYVERLPELLAERRGGALTVVFQTASLGYVGAEDRQRVRETLAQAAEREPLAWIGSAPPLEDGMTAWGMDVRVLPGERRIVAHADFHGAWIDWFPRPA